MGIRGSNFYALGTSIDRAQIRAAWPVAAAPIKVIGYAANWLAGRGVPLVVDGGHSWLPGGDDTQSRVLRYKYHVDSNHSSIGVYIVASCTNSTPVTIGSTIYQIGPQPSIIHYAIPNLSGDVDLETSLLVQWEAGGVTNRNWLSLHNICFYESPEIFIDNSGTTPPEPGTLVIDAYDDRESIAGLERVSDELRELYFRRGTLFNWCNGYDSGRFVTNTSYADFFTSIDPSLQTRHMYNGQTTRSVIVALCADVSGGTGNVRFTMDSGDVLTLNVTATTPTWIQGELAVSTDDPSRFATDGGLRGGVRDNCRIEYRAGSGQDLSMYAISIWDPPGD